MFFKRSHSKLFYFLGASIVFLNLLNCQKQKNVSQKKVDKTKKIIDQMIEKKYKIQETVKNLPKSKWEIFRGDSEPLIYNFRSNFMPDVPDAELLLENKQAIRRNQGDPIRYQGYLEFFDKNEVTFSTDIINQKTGDFEKQININYSYIEDPDYPGLLTLLKNDKYVSWIKILSSNFIVTRMKYGDTIFMREKMENQCIEKKNVIEKKFITYYELESYLMYKKLGKVIPYYDGSENKEFLNTPYNQLIQRSREYYYRSYSPMSRYFIRSNGSLDKIDAANSFADQNFEETFQAFKNLLHLDISLPTRPDLQEKINQNFEPIFEPLEFLCCHMINIPGQSLIMYTNKNEAQKNTEKNISSCLSEFEHYKYKRKAFIVYPNDFTMKYQFLYDDKGVYTTSFPELYILVDA